MSNSANDKFIFDDGLIVDQGKVEGYIWATDYMMDKLRTQRGLSMDSDAGDFNFYTVYDPKTHNLDVIASYYTNPDTASEKNVTCNLYFSRAEQRELFSAMQEYCRTQYNKDLSDLTEDLKESHEHSDKACLQVKLYQVNPYRDENNVSFMRYDRLPLLQNGSASINSSVYDKVFDGKVNARDLEEIYRIFNLDHPEDYTGRSLSVSDIIEVIDPEDESIGFYFCDWIGFQRVDFEPEKTINMVGKLPLSDLIQVAEMKSVSADTAEQKVKDDSLER